MSDEVAIDVVALSEACLSGFYKDHFTTVRVYLSRRLGCPEAGYEAAQDLFLKLWSRPPSAPIDNPRGFLLRTARNFAIDRMRANDLRPSIEPIEDYQEILLDPVADPIRIAEARERLRRLAKLIESLPPKCREVFVLHRFDGLTQKEIAHRLGTSAKMVEAHLARAMLQLRCG